VQVATAKGDFLPEWTLKTTCVIFIFIPQTKCWYCIHSEVNFLVYRPARVTRCTDEDNLCGLLLPAELHLHMLASGGVRVRPSQV